MPKRPIRIEDLLRIVFVGDPQIDPAGNRVLFTRKTISDKNKYVTNLSSVDLDGAIVQWTQGDGGAGHGRWSPDGTQIAFIGGRDKPGSQLYLISTCGGEAKKLSDLPEGKLETFKWSPDGSKIAFTFREQIPAFTEAAKKEREAKGLSTPPYEIDDIWYRLDGDGYFANQRSKLYLLDVATQEQRVLYSGAIDGNYSFDWSPTGQELAVLHTVAKRPAADPPNDQIFRVDLQGQAWQLEGLPKGEKTAIAWSPDGRWLAYGGDIDEADPWGVRNARLYVVPADGGEPRDLTGRTDYDLSVATLSDTAEAAFGAVLRWAPDSLGIFVQIGWHGETQLGYVPLAGGVELRTEGVHQVILGNLSSDGRRIAALYGHATRLPEVAVIQPELGTGRPFPTVLTSLNHEFHGEIKLSEPEEFWLDSTDGTKLHGWVVKPIDYLAPHRYPAILEIHGGPHTQYGWAFFHEIQVLAALGYVVVYTNPRGSKGYGEAHCAAIRGDWGTKDWEDIQTATRWMQAQTYIHPGQLGVMGGSYGGYMTNWAIGHTDAFKAAITDRCVSNMVSMAGNSDFPFNKDGYFKGNAWGSLEEIKELWRQSPISVFDKVKTPTLIIHSEGDLRCNIEQGEQVFTALQQNNIPSRFVRYPSTTSHGLSRSGPPDLRTHRLNEIVKWMDRYLKG
jgi:dipeptidyl aminopeptidase/acylaminoacyl peptidase